MGIEDIKPLNLYASMRPEIREIRIKGPEYMARLVGPLHEKGILQDIQSVEDIVPGQISPLEGGVNSACYWIQEPTSAVAIKIQRDGVVTEEEWLRKYEEVGVPVPKLLDYDVLPGEEGRPRPLRYVALEGITTADGVRAKTATAYVDNDLVMTGISSVLGSALARAHDTVTDKPFGYYVDQEEGLHTHATWAEHLIDTLSADQLSPLGVNPEQHAKLIHAVGAIKFPEKGVYLHGDFNLHNVLVVAPNAKPPEVKIIDPSPIIGDPLHDVASVYGMQEMIQAKKALDTVHPDNPSLWWERDRMDYPAFVEAYVAATGITIDPRRLAANQLSIMLRGYWRRKDVSNATTEIQRRQIEIDESIRRNLILEKVTYLTSKQAS